MCGILGIITPRGSAANISRETFDAIRDAMRHRGPDDAGTWHKHNALLGHRRLAVIETSAAGRQPMALTDERGDETVVVYNGELYNDSELRTTLAADGCPCLTRSDTETLARWTRTHDTQRVQTLRGMYAFASWRTGDGTLLLARDPLGIKPLFYARVTSGGVEHFCFASELQAIEKLLLALGVTCQPDMVTASAYLTTIRTTLGSRTLLRGVACVQPGEMIRVYANSDALRVSHTHAELRSSSVSHTDATERVRTSVTASVRAHLMSDVPVCTLLSGGLDSAIVASVARTRLSFCAGAREEGFASPDFDFAREAATQCGMRHDEAVVTRDLFLNEWPAMVAHNAQPLSTPNEIAIFHVARTLRAAGCVVTLSGEGADELFAGYDMALLQAREAWRSGRVTTAHDAGEFELDANAWISRAMKRKVLTPPALRAAEHDEHLTSFYRENFARIAAERDDDDPLQAHLRWQRRVNLTGLLQRLDTATMRAGVEGRTPFADARVRELAEGLPLACKLRVEADGASVTTKAVLRDAFANDVLPSILRRPKASFPLPFQTWMVDMRHVLGESRFVREHVERDVRELVARDPAGHWHLAWPLFNLALWQR